MPTVRNAYQEAHDFVLGKIYALEQDSVQALYDAYAQAYREIAAAIEAIWQASRLGDSWSVTDTRAREALLRQIAEVMNQLDPEAAQLIYNSIEDSLRAGHYGTGYVLDQSTGRALMRSATLPLLPTEAVRAQVLAPYLGQTWLDRYRDNRAEFELRIKRSLVQSQIQGESMQQAQRRLRDELGIVTDRRLKANRYAHRRNFNRTQMIVRSEIIRASNLGALAVYRANDDILSGWEYKATLDERTCPRCGPLDGRQFGWDMQPIDGKGSTTETLPPPLHPQCRCAALPVLINQRLEREIVGRRETFTEWAVKRGLTRNQYGQAFDFRGKDAPKLVKKGA